MDVVVKLFGGICDVDHFLLLLHLNNTPQPAELITRRISKMRNSLRLISLLLLPVLAVMAFVTEVDARTSTRKIKSERPDLLAIKREVLNPKSDFYFPKLKKKFDANDTVMTPEEYRHFYFGYMFQEDYDPYRKSSYADKTAGLHLKEGKFTQAEYDTIFKYSVLVLKDNPFDLNEMSFLIRALRQRGKTYLARFWEYRLENLLGAIKSSGTGASIEDAWYVIYPMHEYDMVQLLGYEAVDAQYPQEGIDYLLVEPDRELSRSRRGNPVAGFYFNVEIPQQIYAMKYDENPGADDPAGDVEEDEDDAEEDDDL